MKSEITDDVLVSVVTPYYNSHQYIEKTLESLLTQTFTRWEWIIVDDGSEEDSYQKLMCMIAGQPKVRLLRQKNAGQGAARNLGVKEAHSDVIAFLDSDDWFAEVKLQRQFEIISKEGIDIVCTGVQQAGGTRKRAEGMETLEYHKGVELMADLIRSNRYGLSTCMITKSAFDSVGGFSEVAHYRGTEDYHLWLMLARAGFAFHYIPDLLSFYLVRDDSEVSNHVRMYNGMLTAIMETSEGVAELEPVVDARLEQMIPSLLFRALRDNNIAQYNKWLTIGKQRNINLTVPRIMRMIPSKLRKRFLDKLYQLKN